MRRHAHFGNAEVAREIGGMQRARPAKGKQREAPRILAATLENQTQVDRHVSVDDLEDPGLTSAMGLLQTDVKHLYLRSAVGLLSSYPIAEINGIFADLRRRATDDVAEEGLDLKALRLKQQIDLRYLHQGYHLTVDAPDGEVGEAHKPKIKSAFDQLHRHTYGASAPEEEAELVTLRLLAEVPVPHLRPPPIGPGNLAQALIERRPFYDLARGKFLDACVYDRGRLGAGDCIAGPAIVEQYDSTTVVLAAQTLTVDDFGNLLIREEQ